jgi:hypothetical protein
MRTTVDIPDALLARARVRAAELGISLKEFVAEAVTEKVVDGAAIHTKKSTLAPLPRKRG